MNCPSCGTNDAYQGLMGIDCPNSRCNHFKGGEKKKEIDAEIMNKGITMPKGPYYGQGAPQAVVASGPYAQGTWAAANPHPHSPLVARKVFVGSIEDQKDIAEEVLKITKIELEFAADLENPSDALLKERAEDVLIAGGAPRDWYQGKLCHDIDIFCWGNNNRDDATVIMVNISDELWKTDATFTVTQKIQKSAYSYKMIQEVWEGVFKGMIVQWIFLNPKQMVAFGLMGIDEFVNETFDFDICKCIFWIDDKNNKTEVIDVFPSAAFDFNNQTLTVSLKQLQIHDRLLTLPRRSTKMQTYFPNHKIVINP